ncbi:hypothetical protein [Kitasatospora sp. NPDC094015]|uniref:hypothetical protein n=1 Tax=Kitasatospora sp. NPDC094015 TaxID=3155205 RepID=UPI0033257E89
MEMIEHEPAAAPHLIPLSDIAPQCSVCGSTQVPLHPGALERVGHLVRDTVVCTTHLELGR